jgi:hypothetical protein
MNPNRLTRELRNIPGNIRSPRLPGGSIISAVLDRRLMAWSDRGGASRIFGDIWSAHCWGRLTNGLSLFDVDTSQISATHIVRLDDDPAIAIQAGRNKLPNPDFLILTENTTGDQTVRAVDAKFAIDRLKRSQISAEATRNLMELPGSKARLAALAVSSRGSLEGARYTHGAFLGPNSILNDYFYLRQTRGDQPAVPVDELVLIQADADALFEATEEASIINELRDVDGLDPASSETELVVGMYYVRLACAARWFESQEREPLLSLDPSPDVPVSEVLEALKRRYRARSSSFEIIERWSRAAENAIERQKQVRDAARLPVGMGEIRRMLGNTESPEDRRTMREIRAELERQFNKRLIEEYGDIPAQPGKPIQTILDEVSNTSGNLRPEMLGIARRLVAERS